MKPPQQNRSGKRSPGGSEPRRPRLPGDGQEHGRQGGPRQAGSLQHGGPHRDGGSGHAQGNPPRNAPHADRLRLRDDRPSRPDHLHAPPQSSPRRDEPPSGPDRAKYRTPDPRPGPDTPRGTVWLYGSHAVAAALSNPARRLRRLLLTEEAEAALAARRKQPWPLTPERVERGRLDRLLGNTTVHQGAALLADLLATPVLAQVLERSGVVIVLDQVSDPRNVGAILRSAQAFGAAAVIVQERNAPDETGALAKAASGALETVPLLRAVNISRTLVALKAFGYWVVGLDSGGAPLAGPALMQRRVALVLGSEGEGLRRLTRDTCDEVAGIAMPGAGSGLDSLNVSAAAAVALYELGRRT
jgi:23S rRNA (guanosine2251-2'-O)-methyltransferase